MVPARSGLQDSLDAVRTELRQRLGTLPALDLLGPVPLAATGKLLRPRLLLSVAAATSRAERSVNGEGQSLAFPVVTTVMTGLLRELELFPLGPLRTGARRQAATMVPQDPLWVRFRRRAGLAS